ncbi:MAG: DHH family phosphoesterase [Deltaproteobacteria bacterium]|nr:DHH family phosphoesterase [Deltaproteobacteria bacterium]
MTKTAAEKLKGFYKQFSGKDRVLILINADPDAIASAMAVKRLLWRKVSEVTITNINVIKRPDNILLVRILGLDLINFHKIHLSEFDRFVIVDSQPEHNESFRQVKPDVVIDHHPVSSSGINFSDIRPEYGATATIMVEYLKAAKITPSAKLATGLYYAIKTDTNNFVRKTIIEDIRAFQFLYQHANLHMATRIEQADIKPEFLKYFSKALEHKVIKKRKVFAHLGKVINPDVCVLIADFFMRVSSVSWSIVSGIYNKKLVVIFRNDGFGRDAGHTAQKALGDMGPAGGHKSMARAEIRFSDIKIDTSPETEIQEKEILKWIIKKVLKT